MNASDFRKIARERLTGKWGKAALISLLWIGLFFALGFAEALLGIDSNSGFSNLLTLVIQTPMVYGFTILLMQLFESAEVKPTDLFSISFSNFVRAWKIQLHIWLKLLLPICLIIGASILVAVGTGISLIGALSDSNFTAGSGSVILIISIFIYIVATVLFITKNYYYALANFVAIENPNITAKDAVEKSRELMTNRRSKLFFLELSFFGWALLASFSFGIGYLWLIPYLFLAKFAFYKTLVGNHSTVDAEYSVNPQVNVTSNINNAPDSSPFAPNLNPNNSANNNQSSPNYNINDYTNSVNNTLDNSNFDSNLGPIDSNFDNTNNNDNTNNF